MIARPLTQILPMGSSQVDELTYVLQSDGTLPTEAAIRSALARADFRLAAYEMISLDQAARNSRTTERFIFVLVSLFGVLGLILAGIGLYGLLSLQVARREREFGIRTALGATATQIIRLVARQGAGLFVAGVTIGVAMTWGIARLVRSEWAGMPAPNLPAWIGSGAVLLFAVFFACWLPARKAARVDPIIALRAE
jgi:ABC-type antimicrobial peptide transport system permease subunit